MRTITKTSDKAGLSSGTLLAVLLKGKERQIFQRYFVEEDDARSDE